MPSFANIITHPQPGDPNYRPGVSESRRGPATTQEVAQAMFQGAQTNERIQKQWHEDHKEFTMTAVEYKLTDPRDKVAKADPFFLIRL